MELLPSVLRPTTATGSSPLPSLVLQASARHRPRCLMVSSSAGGERKGKKRLFALGTGFVARYASKRLMEEEDGVWDIYGTCTSTGKKCVLEGMGVKAYTFNAFEHRLEKLDPLQHATHLLVSIPPLKNLCDPLPCMLEDLRDILRIGNLQWLCYLSSTSVYGDCQGLLVDEDYPVDPESGAAKARVIAEKGWLDLGIDLQVPSYVFRLGGTYGPGRSALDTIIKGKLTLSQKMRQSKRFTARVHVEDIYQAIKASFHSSASGIFNIVDDDPAPRSEVFSFAKGILEDKFPKIEVKLPKGAEDMADQELTHKGEKQISNTRMKKDLGVNLTYPSYREGLRHVLSAIPLEKQL